MNKFKSFLKGLMLVIVTAVVMYLKENNATIGEMITEFARWFSNNNFIANSSGLFVGIVVTVLGLINQQLMAQNNRVNVDIQAVSPEVKEHTLILNTILQNQKILAEVTRKEITDLKLPIDTKSSILTDLSKMNFLDNKPIKIEPIIAEVKEVILETSESMIEKLRSQV